MPHVKTAVFFCFDFGANTPSTVLSNNLSCFLEQAASAAALDSFFTADLLSLKAAGFSDRQIARYTNTSENQVILHRLIVTVIVVFAVIIQCFVVITIMQNP